MLPEILRRVSLAPYTTLRAGGPAERFAVARTADDMAELVRRESSFFVLGWGSNLLPADAGMPGLVVLNLASRIEVSASGDVVADAGCSFQELFLKTAQAGLRGLEFAVGIPGSLGGALVSNAGAYRSNVSEFLTEIELIEGGERRWVDPSWMAFSYRDSRLRQPDAPPTALLRVRLRLPKGEPKAIYDEAREYQRQRIGKQPPPASAGSFFKNVVNSDLAQRIEGLTDGMRRAGVIPSGFLIEAVGLKGFRLGGARLAPRHANFMTNTGRATSTEIRSLAEHARDCVCDRFGVTLEEEVLYLGDWSGYERIRV